MCTFGAPPRRPISHAAHRIDDSMFKRAVTKFYEQSSPIDVLARPLHKRKQSQRARSAINEIRVRLAGVCHA